MKRAQSMQILRIVAVAAAGGAGWVFGGKSLDPGRATGGQLARAHPVSEGLTPQRPDRAPDGWSVQAWPEFARPDLSAADPLTRRAYEDPEAVRDAVMADHPGPVRNAAILNLLRGWVARDPLAAGEWFGSLRPEETPEMPLADVEPIFASAPAEARAKGVLGFLAAKAEGHVMTQASKGSVKSVERPPDPYRSRPVFSGSWSSTPGRTLSDKLNARTNALAVWACQDPDRALEWVRGRPTPESRVWLMNGMLEGLARSGAADQAIDLYNAETDLHEAGAVRSLGKAWALSDPTAALAWSREIPDPALRDQFLNAALCECPPGQGPELLEFTSEVSDLKTRQSVREHLVTSAAWNQAAVREWLDTDPSLGEQEREDLRARLVKASQEALEPRSAGMAW